MSRKTTKSRLIFTPKETNRVAKNYIALDTLHSSLDSNEFNHVFARDTAKEIWDTLETTYEGTSQVCESKISLYVHQYKLLKMLLGESIKDMYIQFTKIINNLKSLEKPYNNEEMVMKVLQCLPRSKWGPKDTN